MVSADSIVRTFRTTIKFPPVAARRGTLANLTHPFRGAPVTTVALVIDMQADFFGHQRLSLLRPALAAHTNTLTAMGRGAAIPIVWVRQGFASDLSAASFA